MENGGREKESTDYTGAERTQTLRMWERIYEDMGRLRESLLWLHENAPDRFDELRPHAGEFYDRLYGEGKAACEETVEKMQNDAKSRIDGEARAMERYYRGIYEDGILKICCEVTLWENVHICRMTLSSIPWAEQVTAF